MMWKKSKKDSNALLNKEQRENEKRKQKENKVANKATTKTKKTKKGQQQSVEQLQQFVEQSAEKDDLLAGRLVYDQLYGQKDHYIKRLWRVIYLLSGCVLLAIILLMVLGSESKTDPIIVKIDGNNQILDVEQANHLNYHSIRPYMATYMLEQFIKNARGISIDGQYESDRLKSAYAMTQGAATKTLENFITGRDPYSTASTEVITVQIDNVMPNVGGSAHTTQIEWTEIARDPKNDQVLSEKSYTGQLTFQWNKPAKENAVIHYNPLGFYITEISWSENVEHDE